MSYMYIYMYIDVKPPIIIKHHGFMDQSYPHIVDAQSSIEQTPKR